MKHTYLQTSTFSGIDWHDMCTHNNQILENGSPVISDVRKTIIDMVCSDYERFLGTDIKRRKIADVYDGVLGEYTLETSESSTLTIGYSKDVPPVFYAELESQFEVKTYYDVSEIDDKDVVYLPVMEYRNGLKYGDTVERFFHEPFATYEEALDFIDKTKRSDDITKDHIRCGLNCPPVLRYDNYQVFVFDKNELKENKWFKLNMQAIELMREQGINEYDDSFRQSIRVHLSELTGEKNIEEDKGSQKLEGVEESEYPFD